MARPTMLVFNAEARLPRLRFLCMKLGILVQPVPGADCGQSLAALCGLAERAEAATAEAVEAEMIVFCHMDNLLLNRLLKTAKQQRVTLPPLKAILTPANAAWTPAQLCRELQEERAAILAGGKAHQGAEKEEA